MRLYVHVLRFGVKEEYMCFMNDFVETEIKNMKEFLNKISVSRTVPCLFVIPPTNHHKELVFNALWASSRGFLTEYMVYITSSSTVLM